MFMRGSREGTGGPHPLKNHKATGFLSNAGSDPMENHKATKPAFNDGLFKWRFADGPLSPYQLKNRQSRTPSDKFSGSAHLGFAFGKAFDQIHTVFDSD